MAEDKWKRTSKTPFHVAAECGNITICKIIVEHLEDISPRNRFGETPYDFALRNFHFDVCFYINDVKTLRSNSEEEFTLDIGWPFKNSWSKIF